MRETLAEARQISRHRPDDFEGMRRAGRLAAEVLDMITDHVAPGVTTEELDRLCHDMIAGRGAVPAPLGYKGFPNSIRRSLNHVVCHGSPGDRKLPDGEKVNHHGTVVLAGWRGASRRTEGGGVGKEGGGRG